MSGLGVSGRRSVLGHAPMGSRYNQVGDSAPYDLRVVIQQGLPYAYDHYIAI